MRKDERMVPEQAQNMTRWLNAVFLILCVAVLLYVWGARSGDRYADELDYWAIAGNVAQGNGFTINGVPTAFRPPAWPLLLVPAQLVGADVGLATLTSAACLIVAAAIAGRLGVLLTRHPLGRLAAIFVLAYPINIYTASTLYPQMLALLCTLSMWWVLAKAEADEADRSWSDALVLGASAGVVTLAVPTMAFTAVAFLVACSVMLWKRRFWGGLITSWGLAGAIVGAWTVRNWFVFREFIPLSTSTGINLLLGNNPNATADSGVNADISASIERVYSMGLSENGRSRELTREALDWVSQHPWDAFVLYLQKTAHYFVAYDAPATPGQGGTVVGIVAWTAMLGILALTVVRWTPSGRSLFPVARAELVMLFVFLANAPVMALFFTRVRFRVPLDCFLLVEATIGTLIVLSRLVPALRRSTGDGG